MKKHTFLTSYFFIIIYFIISFSIISQTAYRGDTYQYYLNFQEIDNIQGIYIYHTEWITPFLMFLVKKIGLTFDYFLFICTSLWSLIFYRCLKTYGTIAFLPLFLFVISDHFIGNSIYLIRNYIAALLFILFFIRKNIIFAFFSFFAHSSSIIWYVIFNKLVLNLIFKNKNLFLFLFACLPLFYILNINELIIGYLSNETAFITIELISRKIQFYSTERLDGVNKISTPYLFLAFINFLIAYYSFYKSKILIDETKIDIFFIINSALVIILSQDSVLANRVGFFGYYFAIPYFIYKVKAFFSKKRIF